MAKPALKILLAEDDESFRNILKTLLTKAGYDVTVAQDGKVAQHIISAHPFDVVLSDIQMPHMNGIDLLKWIKAERTTPVILMTGFAEILETKNAYELGADEFLPKPFKQEDLLAAIDSCKKKQKAASGEKEEGEEGDKKEPTAEEIEKEYCKLNIDDFVVGNEIPYGIFIRLSDTKYVKIAYKGEDISINKIREYKTKGVTQLYMRVDEFKSYLDMNLKIARGLTQAKKIPKAKKLNLLKHAGEILQERLFISGVDQEGFSNAKDFVSSALSIATDDNDVFTMIEMLETHSDHLYAHSLGVSLYSVMLAKKARWHSVPNRYRVAMAGLFHDIGKKEIDREILEKQRVRLNQTERAMVETHPARGQEIISQIKSLPPDLAQIVYQHHEDCNGYGYPAKLTKNKIHPIARLIAVADAFCNYVIAGPQSDGMPAKEAINQILQFSKDRLDQEFLGYLMQSFDYHPVKERKV